jgi:2-amino-4-hydroxy-6-hydroxymethyldihydropteridine diphosphokinase
LIALGSNRCHGGFGPPRRVIEAALSAIKLPVIARSHVYETDPLGPGKRRYANAVAIVEWHSDPVNLLDQLKAVECRFGRRSAQLWGDRVLDLDIILWSGGAWSSSGLTIPHPSFRARSFVLNPAQEIAAKWRDPLTGFSVRHLKARLDRKPPLP